MGRYCGILNRTKKQSISSYWKGDNWCNCYEVMHQFHWNKDDQIESGGGYEWYEIKYDTNTNTMESFEIDIMAEMSKAEEQDNNPTEVFTKYGFDTRLVYGKNALPKSYKLGKSKYTFVDEDDEDDDGNVEEFKSLAYITDDEDDGIVNELNNFEEEVNDKYNHLPEWDGDKCTKCRYVYDEKMLAKYAKWFDQTFHFN
ncbi:hypothetical protein Klosneuvirus_16_1 [Klosneuvirus KNV1]|uniref:Uncharacterized protein n=1 Tax=Klosneuvirus KNV1 TaxID=1977640 RepID=A0A1V0SLU4_9VIRU|nr:hypothetical protein Klosneuvirus_16_1 [Klosneuvirus KNV1]